MSEQVKLPQMPDAYWMDGEHDVWTADQMRAYALQAVKEDRERALKEVDDLMPQNPVDDWTEYAKTKAEALLDAAAAIRSLALPE